MTVIELRKALTDLTDKMDSSILSVEDAAKKTQQLIYEMLLEQVNRFEISDGRFVVGQNYSARLAIITKQINAIIGEVYNPSIREYLGGYATVDQMTLSLHKSYNELLIDKQKLTPARRIVYDQAEYFLTEGLADAYVQPAKYLLMQAVTTGITIKDAERLLRNWNDGELGQGKLSSSRPTPRLQSYAGQIASDSLFQYHGTIQKIIGEQYNLNKMGIYVGDIIKDSRPACKYLVGLNRKIDIDEIPKVLIKYPDGIIPNTTKKNFPVYRCGYRCRHTWMWVRA